MEKRRVTILVLALVFVLVAGMAWSRPRRDLGERPDQPVASAPSVLRKALSGPPAPLPSTSESCELDLPTDLVEMRLFVEWFGPDDHILSMADRFDFDPAYAFKTSWCVNPELDIWDFEYGLTTYLVRLYSTHDLDLLPAHAKATPRK